MNVLTVQDARQELEQIDASACSPMRKTRRLLELSRRLRRSIVDLEHCQDVLDHDGDEGAGARVLEWTRGMRRLDEDVRLRALRTLKASRRIRLGFGYGPQVAPKAIWGGGRVKSREA